MSPDEIAKVLGQPITINKLKLANRMVMAPMALAHAPNKDGSPSEQTIAFYAARAQGGIGLIFIGGLAASRRLWEEAPGGCLRFDSDDAIPAFRRIADAVHAYGTPIFAQVMPGLGRMGKPAEGPPIAASPINVVVPEDQIPNGIKMPGGMATPMPREATLAEIRQAEQDMIEAADRTRRAGLDGVEVSAQMSYLLSSFLSPRTNWRTDEYGGSVENRARILVNIFSGIRQRLGPDYPLGLRLTSNEYLPDGQGAEGYAAIARLVTAAGADYVALSPGNYETMGRKFSDGEVVESGDAGAFKQVLSVPVFVPMIHDPARSAKAIAEGAADVVMMARPMLADPGYAGKVVQGRLDAIVKCKHMDEGCSYCMRRLSLMMPIRCVVNPRMGRESRRGGLPPLKRVFEAPVEQIMLKVVTSRPLMKLVTAVRGKGPGWAAGKAGEEAAVRGKGR